MKNNWWIKIVLLVGFVAFGMSSFAQGVVVKTKDGTQYRFSYQALDEIMVYEEFTDSILYPGDKKPEEYLLINEGFYQHGVQSLTQDTTCLFNDAYVAELYQCKKDPNKYCIKPWLNNPNGLCFKKNPVTNEVTVPKQETGYETQDYGPLYGQDVKSYGASADLISGFEEGMFIFYMGYVVNAGAFGYQLDVFVLPEEQPAAKQSKKMQRNKTLMLDNMEFKTLKQK